MDEATSCRKKQEWVSLVKGELYQQVLVLAFERDMYEEYQEVLADSTKEVKKATVFHDWLKGLYVTNVSVGVRRVTDRDRRVVSLVKLLEDIEKYAACITREWYLGHYEDAFLRQQIGEPAFDAWGRETLEPMLVAEDRGRIVDATSAVKRYVDKRLAHHERTFEESIDVTWSELNTAVDVIEQVFCRYYELLTASSLMINDITHQHWDHIFWNPWVESPESVKRYREMVESLPELVGESEDA